MTAKTVAALWFIGGAALLVAGVLSEPFLSLVPMLSILAGILFFVLGIRAARGTAF